MRLSTKARVAVSAMMYLATHAEKGPSNANQICEDQDISVSYLEQLFAHLRRHGLVVGVRGPGGGYRLGRPAEQISVADIIMAVDDHAYTRGDDKVVSLYQGGQNPIQGMWRELSGRLYHFLEGITLAECIETPGGDGNGQRENPGEEDVARGKQAPRQAGMAR